MNGNNTHNGFTLIELLVSLTIVVVLLVAGFSMFVTTFVAGNKTEQGEYIKQAGQNALSSIGFLIRNTREILPNTAGSICASDMPEIVLRGLDGKTTRLFVSGTQIASNSGNFLTPQDLELDDPLTFSCLPSSYGTSTWDGSPPRVTIRFSLQKKTSGAVRVRDALTIPFTSTVTLRNF